MKFKCNIYGATVYQVLIPLLLLWFSRFTFYAYNADVIGELSAGQLLSIGFRGTVFDIVAVAYVNSLFVLMRFLPFDFVMRRWWQRLTMVVYGLTNGLMLIVNIGDIAYFRFNNGHMQMETFLRMFDPALLATAMMYVRQYWWAFAGIIFIVALLLWLAARVKITRQARGRGKRVALLLVALAVTYVSMRGGRVIAHPVGIDTAAAIARQPKEINVLLNTPFCIIRSSRSTGDMPPYIFFSDRQLESFRTSLHYCTDMVDGNLKAVAKGKNIVLIILESGAQIWLDSISVVDNKPYAGYMPFINSLGGKSMALTSTFCTGSTTIGGLASILGGIPTFGQQNWMSTKYATQTIDSPARLLKDEGYDTHFYIGTDGELFSVGPLAKAMGFTVTDRSGISLPDKGNTNTWGIYDQVMGKYIVNELSGLKQPFFAAWLTLDLHGPYSPPKKWVHPDYPQPGDDMLRCVQYTDYSIRCFFEIAQQQPWFDNTLFIITADHGFRDFPASELNGTFVFSHVPFLLYTPDGSIPAGKHGGRAMAQYDIPPTLLWLAGYDRPYVGVGTNLFDDSKPHYGLIQRWDGWHIISPRYLVSLPYSADRIGAVYDVVADPRLNAPLDEYDAAAVDSMYTWFKAFMQDYTVRANNNRLTIANEPF